MIFYTYVLLAKKFLLYLKLLDQLKNRKRWDADANTAKILYNVTTVTFMNPWILLNYKLPAKPTSLRVYAWRKLKRLGAVLLNDAIWVLPATPRTEEQFQWLAVEIQEMRGEATLWHANLVLGISENTLVEQFTRQVDQEYKELMKKLDNKNADSARISQQYQLILGKDYFQSELGLEVKKRLLSLRGPSK